jgi:hypothetical protein
MVAGRNVPVLVGAVPLFAVTSMTLNEGYQVARIAGSRLAQLVSPTTRTIQVEATLLGSTRLLVKKGLEMMALVSRASAAGIAPGLSKTGLPVVSGLTIALEMQITTLKFTQSNTKRDAIDVSLTLEHVPRSSVVALVGEALDLALAVTVAALPSVGGMQPLSKQLGGPM